MICPVSPRARRCTPVLAVSTSLRMTRASSSINFPASVSSTPRVRRWNSGVPISFSNCRICKLSPRLVDAQPFGRAGEIQLLGDGNKIAEMA